MDVSQNILRLVSYFFILMLSAFVLIFAFATSANAGICGFYAGFNIGRMNLRISSLSSASVPTDVSTAITAVPGSTFTSTPGGFSYVASNVLTQSLLAVNSFNSSQTGNLAAGNVFLGYQFNTYFALEFGLGATTNFKNSYNATINENITGTGVERFGGGAPIGGVPYSATLLNVSRNDTVNTSLAYLVAKVIYPVNNCVELFTKLGYAYVWQRTTSSITISNLSNAFVDGLAPFSNPGYAVSASGPTSSSRKSSPMIGLGGSYLWGSFSVDLLWSRILISTSSDNNNLDYLGIGITARF